MAFELAVVLGNVGIVFVWFLISYKLGEEHFFLKLLFFFLGFVNLLSLMSQVYEIVNAQSTVPTNVLNSASNDYFVVELVFVIVFLYFLVWMVVKWYREELFVNKKEQGSEYDY